MSLKSIQELVSIYPEYNFMRNMWEFQNSCFETPFLLPGIRKELSVAVPAGYGNENGKLRETGYAGRKQKREKFHKRIYHAEAPKWLKYAILFGYPVLLFILLHL